MAQRLDRDGIKLGDRVATLAWNTWRHLESWYGILGIGAIYHTVNPRLFPEQIAWIVNHAEDRVMMTDLTFVPLLEKIADKLPTIERYIVLTDAAHMPATTLRNAVAYEDWIAEVDGDFAWKDFDENTAAGMCYTSGTTGNPKGVVYSHRSNVLHTMLSLQPDAFGLSSRDVVMPIVPMFHANSWGLAFSSPMTGAAMVMPGAKLDGASVYELLNEYKVTCTGAVPTVWLMLLQHLEKTGGKLPYLEARGDRRLGLPARHDQDLPGRLRRRGHPCLGHDRDEPARHGRLDQAANMADLKGDALLDIKQKQGHTPFGVEMKITDDAGTPDALGRQDLRPPQGARLRRRPGLFQGRRTRFSTTNGFFDTGDVGTIDRYGYMQITDRSKDVIKSGGEWISSIDLENLAVGHPESGGGGRDRRAPSEMGRAAAPGHRAQGGRNRRPRRRSSASWRARSPNGGCRTTSCSSARSRTPRPARSRRPRCATNSRITCCRRRSPPNRRRMIRRNRPGTSPAAGFGLTFGKKLGSSTRAAMELRWPGKRPAIVFCAVLACISRQKRALRRLITKYFPEKFPIIDSLMEQFASGAPHNFHNIGSPDHSVQI